MLGSAFGDHLDGVSEWMDDRSHRGGRCHQCGSDQTLVRHRVAYGPGLPLHRHEVLACLDCERWAATCHAAPAEPEVLAWQ